MMYLFGILGKTLKNSEGINFFQEITHIIEKKTDDFRIQYSVDSIKHTVLLKVLRQIFQLISIKNTVHWIFSRQINFVYCLY